MKFAVIKNNLEWTTTAAIAWHRVHLGHLESRTLT